MSGDLLEYRVFTRPAGGGPSEAGQWQPAAPGTVPLPGAMAIEFRSVPLPSADALRAYLAASGWTECGSGTAGSLWVRGGRQVGVMHDDDEFALRGAVERVALAEGRSAVEVMRAASALQEAPRGAAGAPAADEAGREATTGDARSQDRTGAPLSQPERDLIHADLGQLLDLLGLGDYARPESPHEVFRQCIREVARLIGQNWKLGGAFSREAAQGPPSGDAGAQPRVSTVAPMLPGAVPAGWVFAAEAQLSLHGRDLLRHVIAGVAPAIAAAERERIALLAEDRGAVYTTLCPCGSHDGSTPFADLIREENPGGS